MNEVADGLSGELRHLDSLIRKGQARIALSDDTVRLRPVRLNAVRVALNCLLKVMTATQPSAVGEKRKQGPGRSDTLNCCVEGRKVQPMGRGSHRHQAYASILEAGRLGTLQDELNARSRLGLGELCGAGVAGVDLGEVVDQHPGQLARSRRSIPG